MSMPKLKNTIYEYVDDKGVSPYAQWLSNLRDARAKAKIMIQVDKMEIGLLGDVEPIGEGLSELRIHYGPGYRVYFGKEGQRVYLLLCGGDKSSQSKDIKKAKDYWKDHRGRNKDNA